MLVDCSIAWSSLRKRLSQIISPMVCPKAIYLALIVNMDMVLCFLLYQDTIVLLMKK